MKNSYRGVLIVSLRN